MRFLLHTPSLVQECLHFAVRGPSVSNCTHCSPRSGRPENTASTALASASARGARESIGNGDLMTAESATGEEVVGGEAQRGFHDNSEWAAGHIDDRWDLHAGEQTWTVRVLWNDP